jgi:hypothetical protein
MRAACVRRKRKRRSGEERMMKEKGKEDTTKILLIGENPDIPLFSALQKEGYEAIASESSEKAWPLVYTFHTNLIIVHLNTARWHGRFRLWMRPRFQDMRRSCGPSKKGPHHSCLCPWREQKIKKIVDDLVASHG